MSMQYGHWEYPTEIDPNEWFGFVYRIIDLDTGQHYLGKKQFWSTTRKTIKGKTRKKIVRKQSDWMRYTSSSRHINEAITERGIDRFVFLIEVLYKTKAALHYGEVEIQVLEDVLRARLPNGERKYYNGMVANIKFLPPTETPEEAVMRIRDSRTQELNILNESFGKMTEEERTKWMEKYRLT